MEYRALGRTGLEVSLICLGTMTWGEQNTEAEAHAQIDCALAQGVNFIDTAEMYPVQMMTFDKLIRAGKARAIGVSNETSWGICEFVKVAERDGLPRIASIQNAYNLLNRSFEQSLDEACLRENVALLAYSPLAFGQLSGKYIDDPQVAGRPNHFPKTWSPRYVRPAAYEGARRYRDLARLLGISPTAIALAWCYSRWFVASTIIGATSVDQLRENLDTYATTLSDDVRAETNSIHSGLTNPAQ